MHGSGRNRVAAPARRAQRDRRHGIGL